MLAAPALSHAQYTENDRQNPKEYTNEDSQPLRIAAYIIAPVGFLLEWTVARPIHYVANNTFLAPVFNGDTSRPRDYEPIAELPPDPSMEPGRDLPPSAVIPDTSKGQRPGQPVAPEAMPSVAPSESGGQPILH